MQTSSTLWFEETDVSGLFLFVIGPVLVGDKAFFFPLALGMVASWPCLDLSALRVLQPLHALFNKQPPSALSPDLHT